MADQTERYFVKHDWQKEEIEVSRKEFASAERAAGFYSTTNSDLATGGFSGNGLSGRIERAPHPSPQPAPPRQELKGTMQDAIDSVMRQPAPASAWIPVSERLPDESVDVLIVLNGTVQVGYLRVVGSSYVWKYWGGGAKFKEVSKWMPLPEVEPLATPRAESPQAAPRKKACNRHDDCDFFDAKYLTEHPDKKYVPLNLHCHDEDCEDCFGK